MKSTRGGDRKMAPKGVSRERLEAYLGGLLQTERFKDYCPNGLQVEGAPRVLTLVSGVSASLAFLRAAVRAGADAVLVHHGWFWRGEDPRVLGMQRERLALVLAHRLNLFAYHLPLDVHPAYGNNIQFGLRLGWTVDGRFGEEGLGCWHDAPRPLAMGAVLDQVKAVLGREPLLLGKPRRALRRVAWCTGAAQDMIREAAAAGADLFISGEVSERTTHLARELGVAYLSAGHHATERFGVQALGEHLAAEFGLAHRFIDDPNPV